MKLIYADEMVAPSQCKHERTLQVHAKADDRQHYGVSHLEIDRADYAPRLSGVCHGDYVDFTLCLDCGQVISRPFPVSDEDVREAFGLGE